MLKASLQNNLDSNGNRRFDEVNDKNNVDFIKKLRNLTPLIFPFIIPQIIVFNNLMIGS
jgi:hypothetical protein